MAATDREQLPRKPLDPPLYDEDDLVAISALSQFLYCPRRCALIHIEQQWSENVFTAEGRILHERVHTSGRESPPLRAHGHGNNTLRGIRRPERPPMHARQTG